MDARRQLEEELQQKKIAFEQLEIQLLEKDEHICKLVTEKERVILDIQAHKSIQQGNQQSRTGVNVL